MALFGIETLDTYAGSTRHAFSFFCETSWSVDDCCCDGCLYNRKHHIPIFAARTDGEVPTKYLVDHSPFVVKDDKKMYEAMFFFDDQGEMYVRTSEGDEFSAKLRLPEREIAYNRPADGVRPSESGKLILMDDGTLRNIPPVPNYPSGPELTPRQPPPAV